MAIYNSSPLGIPQCELIKCGHFNHIIIVLFSLTTLHPSHNERAIPLTTLHPSHNERAIPLTTLHPSHNERAIPLTTLHPSHNERAIPLTTLILAITKVPYHSV